MTRRELLERREQARRRRRWLLLVLILVILLALLRDCSCAEAPPAAVVPVPEPLPVATGKPDPTGRVRPRARPAFTVEAPGAPAWLAALRLQVAARGPRLADCFVGSPRPGTLRWSAAVDPRAGRVSDQALEPTLASDPLSREQRDCALAVLADPAYRLDAGDEPATPSRVAMVIEF